MSDYISSQEVKEDKARPMENIGIKYIKPFRKEIDQYVSKNKLQPIPTPYSN